MWLTGKRIIKAGFISFWRNGFISLASIIVITITLLFIGSLIFINALLSASLEDFKDKVDINVYFKTVAPEEAILAVQKELEALTQVERVIYVSREEALDDYKQRHQDDTIKLRALEELGENPLRAKLSIKATDPSQYESIDTFLATMKTAVASDGTSYIDKVNYNENRVAIEKLTDIINTMDKVGFAVTVTLIAASILIVFNTIRLAIYTAREEIAVMRLVGASYAYIRGPFVFEGVMYGGIAAIITLLSFYPLTLWLGPKTEDFTGTINLFAYYTANFGTIFITIVGAGVLLGAVSSFLAVKKYLKV
jgi:cell division transport system permease protein